MVAELSTIEDRLYFQLIEVIDPAVRIELERTVDQAMASMKFRSASTREDTRRALVRKRLRQSYGVPVFEIDLAGGWS